jgi:cell division protein FtsB
MFTNKKLKEENKSLKQRNDELYNECCDLKTKIGALEHDTFKEFKDVPVNDFIEKFNRNDLTFGEMMYFAIFVLPVTQEAQNTLEKMMYGKDSKE